MFQEGNVLTSLLDMQLALRVLTSLTDKRHPEPADVESLQSKVPNSESMPLDELACAVIEAALKHRAEVRNARKGHTAE
jgi:hypothetical protein